MSNLEELLKGSKDGHSFSKMLWEMMLDMFKAPQEIRWEIPKMEEKKDEFVDRIPCNSTPLSDVDFLQHLARDNEESASRLIVECNDISSAGFLSERARRLRSIADKLDRLESNANSAPYYVTGPGILSVYDAAEKATLRGLEEGEAVSMSSSTLSYKKWKVDLMGTWVTCKDKDIEFDEKDVQSVVATTGGIPVVVPQTGSTICPQGHHLKDGKCLRDYCHCFCSKCCQDCGER